MGQSKSRIYTESIMTCKDKYDEAYKILGYGLLRKSLNINKCISLLQKENWNNNDIIDVLTYVKYYHQSIGSDRQNIIESLNTWIDILIWEFKFQKR